MTFVPTETGYLAGGTAMAADPETPPMTHQRMRIA
jgi:hypothetical protein